MAEQEERRHDLLLLTKKSSRAFLQSPSLNGIDYLEVAGPTGCGQQLAVTLLKDARSVTLTPPTSSLPAARRSQSYPSRRLPSMPLRPYRQPRSERRLLYLSVAIDRGCPAIADPPDGFDPQLSTSAFPSRPAALRRLTACPITAALTCPGGPGYQLPGQGLRWLSPGHAGSPLSPSTHLDRTHAADLGVAMVETLAYAADHLSYQQDAVSTEAYLGTARSRISLRRHAKLVDYKIGEGCNACTWVVSDHHRRQHHGARGHYFYVRHTRSPAAVRSSRSRRATACPEHATYLCQQAGHDTFSRAEQMDFYAWGDADCCLPPGATRGDTRQQSHYA